MGENNKYVYSEHMTSMMKVFENPYKYVEEAVYESPIKLIENEWSTQMEGNILKAVKRVGIDIDKEELLRALEYDRDQYNKGYRDGVNTACERILKRLAESESYSCSPQFSKAMDRSMEIVKDEIVMSKLGGFYDEEHR